MTDIIGIFGGSFDPPHNGHLLLSTRLMRAVGASRVIIIPAASSPFKNGCRASSFDRLEMCRRTFSSDKFIVSDIELRRGGVSYTVDTLSEIKNFYPESKLMLFMGDDMFLSFSKWHRYREILKMARLVVICRKEDPFLPGKIRCYAKDVLGLSENEYTLSLEPPYAVSSTLIREKIKNGEDVSQYITEEVGAWIRTEGLYVD